jgi:hypothetical protein
VENEINKHDYKVAFRDSVHNIRNIHHPTESYEGTLNYSRDPFNETV